MIICFNGIDGSGKSYQAQQLVERLRAEGYPAVHVWTGGKRSLRRPIIRLGKWLLRKRTTDRVSRSTTATETNNDYKAYLSSTQRILRRPWLRRAWLNISLIEHTLEIWAYVAPHLLRKRIVVCDRYLHDSIIRVAVLSGTDPAHLPQQLRSLRWFRVPRPTISFLIDVPAAVAFGRKNDIPDLEFLKRRIPLYHAAATTLDLRVIDGTGTPDEISTTIWQHVQPQLAPAPTAALTHG